MTLSTFSAATVIVATGLVSFAMAAQTYPQQKFWRYSSPRIRVNRIATSVNHVNPPCAFPGNAISATDVVARAGAATIDKYAGTPETPKVFEGGLTAALLNAVGNAGNRQWLRDRFSGGNGLSGCATQCVLVQKEKGANLSIFGCVSEIEGDGVRCGQDGWRDDEQLAVYNLTHRETTNVGAHCMTGKNWSNSRDRWFWVVATNVNPVNGGLFTESR